MESFEVAGGASTFCRHLRELVEWCSGCTCLLCVYACLFIWLRVRVWTFAYDHKDLAVPLSQRVIQIIFLICCVYLCVHVCICACVSLCFCFIVAVICSRPHQVSQEAINMRPIYMHFLSLCANVWLDFCDTFVCTFSTHWCPFWVLGTTGTLQVLQVSLHIESVAKGVNKINLTVYSV